MCDVDLNDILLLRGDISIRGHRYKLMQERCTNNYRKNFFAQRVWLQSGTVHAPPSIVDFSSFTSFKRLLNNVNLSIFRRF